MVQGGGQRLFLRRRRVQRVHPPGGTGGQHHWIPSTGSTSRRRPGLSLLHRRRYDAFPLRKWLLKPYSRRAMTHKERVMNYRTSRARRVVENGFGILAHRWRCLLTTLQLEPDRVIRVVLGCLTLHNWLRKRRPGLQDLNLDREDEDGNVVPGAWREDVQMTEPNQMVGQRASREGKTLRNYLADYYQFPTWHAYHGKIGLFEHMSLI